MNQFKDKQILITGGNSGMGLASAKAFIAQGAHVLITGKNADNLKKAAAEINSPNLKTILSDTSDIKSIEALAATVAQTGKKLDVLFLNAGIGRFGSIEQTSVEDFDIQFNTNVRGLYFTLQKLIPHLKDGASVILNSSVVSTAALANMSAYSATKAAVSSIGRIAATELAAKNIRVNILSPGPIETPIMGKSGLPAEAVSNFKAGLVSGVPLGRIGQAHEIADTVLFLASDASSFITGVELQVDGGVGLKR